eukprot:jgi/Chlat1/1722/Chrsp13S08691
MAKVFQGIAMVAGNALVDRAHLVRDYQGTALGVERRPAPPSLWGLHEHKLTRATVKRSLTTSDSCK